MMAECDNGVSVDVLKNALELTVQLQHIDTHVNKTYYSGEELLSLGIGDVPKLWEPFFPTKGLVGLTGSSDCGKSIFFRQLAMAVAAKQQEFLGFPLRTKHGKALYVCTEDDYEGIAALLYKQSGGIEKKCLSNIHFMFDCPNLLASLEEYLNSNSIDLLVLDVWSDTYVGNPNNWADVRQNLFSLKKLASKHQCLIALIHHTVKNSEKSAPDKNKLNGSQAIEAKLRCLLELRNGDASNERLLYVLKNNYMSTECTRR